ncbi:MAG: putative DNA binding domain-containing protein [Bacteroidales bacterium]|nr:putative DNA binding domain-containing protein [Bacteroidales bacterium]
MDKEKRKISKQEIDFIISQGEGQFTEFKERLDKSLAKEIVALANSTGGKILIGIDDSGNIQGAKITNKVKSQVIDTALNCDPKIFIDVSQIENLIVVSVPESKNKPHSCSTGFYLRVGANSQKLTRDEIFKQAINFITKRIKVEFVIESVERKEIPQFPEEAYREAVVNAIMHRDYVDKSSDVFIEVYRDMIIITNPGGLVKWLRKEDFGKISKTRNPLIASLLARTQYVEKMGTGISRMNNAMKNAGLPELIFDYDDFTFLTTIKGNIDNEKTTTKATTKTTTKTTGKQDLILEAIKNNKHITAKQLANELSLTEEGIRYHIKKLKKAKLINYIGPAKGEHWEVNDSELGIIGSIDGLICRKINKNEQQNIWASLAL